MDSRFDLPGADDAAAAAAGGVLSKSPILVERRVRFVNEVGNKLTEEAGKGDIVRRRDRFRDDAADDRG